MVILLKIKKVLTVIIDHLYYHKPPNLQPSKIIFSILHFRKKYKIINLRILTKALDLNDQVPIKLKILHLFNKNQIKKIINLYPLMNIWIYSMILLIIWMKFNNQCNKLINYFNKISYPLMNQNVH